MIYKKTLFGNKECAKKEASTREERGRSPSSLEEDREPAAVSRGIRVNYFGQPRIKRAMNHRESRQNPPDPHPLSALVPCFGQRHIFPRERKILSTVA